MMGITNTSKYTSLYIPRFFTVYNGALGDYHDADCKAFPMSEGG